MNRFKRHKLWIITVLLSAPVIVLAAVPNVFQSGTVISSAAVNANFTALDTRIAALEAAINRSKATAVWANSPGPLPKTVAFASEGGPLLLILSGTGYTAAAAPGPLAVTVQLDAVNIGELRGYTNEGGTHRALPTRVFRVAAAAGNHTLNLVAVAGFLSDGNDFFSLTVVELAH